MAEVEAICAKLQSKPMSNGQTGELSNGEFNCHRRKRKADAPRNITHSDGPKTAGTISDRSCGALDLTVNQPTLSQSTDTDSVLLPTFLQNPLMNIFMNKRDLHEKFKYILDNQKTSNSLTNSDSKSDEDVKETVAKVHDRMFTDKQLPLKDATMSLAAEFQDDCIKRFSSYEECRDEQCRQSLLRDHFHCAQCKKTIMRREEMVRHSKWHKKREESLQFNFMRFSPGDDCKECLCSYNGRQTHYHCLHPGCNKIYISTSDVQMHSNFHKKDAAINEEGFQRYRATEFCCTSTCSYNNQRTTHFHCMRDNCKFTFKNKADMDKHKGHHQRNDSLSKEGFRKYIKYEHCDFNGCKFSKLMNHIHCVRTNCDYVVHSSAQINSHRRKHDRRILTSGSLITSDQKSDSSSVLNLSKHVISSNVDEETLKASLSLDKDHSHIPAINLYSINCQFISLISLSLKDWEKSSQWTADTRRFTANDSCVSHCGLLYKDHYHCLLPGCNVAFKMKEKLRDHCRRHIIDGLLLQHCFNGCVQSEHLNAQNLGSITSIKTHYHCRWSNCNYVRAGPEDVNKERSMDFNFLQEIYDHFDFHESRFHLLVNTTNKVVNASGHPQSSDEGSTNSDAYQFSIDAERVDSFLINTERKRGRPPKYRKNIHIPKIELNDTEMNDDDTITELTKEQFSASVNDIVCGFKFYPASHVFCADDMCMYYGRSEHFHCLRLRCHHATDSLTAVNLHRREFHHYMQIEVGYEYFDRSINCRRSQCQNNRVNSHYHCVRLNCDYSFKRFNTMHQHSRKHSEVERQKSEHILPLASSQQSQNLENSSMVPSSNYSANTLLSDYSRSFSSLYPIAKFSPGEEKISLPIIPALSNNFNLNSLINFTNTLSPFHNSFKAFMENNANCYPIFSQTPSKMPRLQLE